MAIYYSEADYNANLNTSGYKPAYSDLVSKLGDINSKLTFVDDTVIFKAGQTTQSESLVLKVEGELPEFVNFVSPDLFAPWPMSQPECAVQLCSSVWH